MKCKSTLPAELMWGRYIEILLFNAISVEKGRPQSLCEMLAGLLTVALWLALSRQVAETARR